MSRFMTVPVVVVATVITGCADDPNEYDGGRVKLEEDETEEYASGWVVDIPHIPHFEQMIAESVLEMAVDKFVDEHRIYPRGHQILYRANWDARETVQDILLGAQSGGRSFSALYGQVYIIYNRTELASLYEPALMDWRCALLDRARDFLSDPARLKAMYTRYRAPVVRALREKNMAVEIKAYLSTMVIPIFKGESLEDIPEHEQAYIEGFKARRMMEGGNPLVNAWAEIFQDFASRL